MSFLADFHIHSHFSIATSRDCDPENIFLWACIKGISLVGTGDFTHPGWQEELGQKLMPAEEGLFRLRPEYESAILDRMPKSCLHDVRFILSCEISSIYKRGGKTRKVHNCIMVPTMEDAQAVSGRLERIGNIRADGRPILGIDSRDLLEIMLEESPKGIFIPAHIWTPHFSLFGAYSGFDTLEECFADLSPHIRALETGLSSDPPMNWRLSALDGYTLVSNSDAHSPKNLAREANVLECEFAFPAIKSAIEEKDKGQFKGTVEFFPQEGKYHFNGHRNCGIRLGPEETAKLGGVCPKCGRQLTLGVMHRVAELADRPPGAVPDNAPPYKSLIPLTEIISDFMGCGKNSKMVSQLYFKLINNIGPEWKILQFAPVEELRKYACATLADGIDRVRKGNVRIEPGFDGEYGTISVFQPDERMGRKSQISLFAIKEELPCMTPKAPGTGNHKESPAREKPSESYNSGEKHPCIVHENLDAADCKENAALEDKDTFYECLDEGRAGGNPGRSRTDKEDAFYEGINEEQLKAVQSPSGPVLVIAGPGTGKTRTLVYRIAYLLKKGDLRPGEIMAITFTNKAAREMKMRLESINGNDGLRSPSSSIFIGTFHQFCLEILKTYGPDPDFILFHTHDSLGLIGLILKDMKDGRSVRPRDCLHDISRIKAGKKAAHPAVIESGFFQELYERYQNGLASYNALDYDDLLVNAVRLLKDNTPVLKLLSSRYRHILVDEFQDVNPVQYELIKLLAGEKAEGLFAIGDPNQSIYGFRGADGSLFFRLIDEFPFAHVCTLESNYRTTSPIIESALSVISNNPQPEPVKLRSMRGQGPLIHVMELASEKAEGIAIVKEITALVGGIDMLQAHGESCRLQTDKTDIRYEEAQGYGRHEQKHEQDLQSDKRDTRIPSAEHAYSFSDFAILFRTCSQADIIEECLIKEGIPYQLSGHNALLENPIVRKILALLRWCLHPKDEYSLLQAIDLPILSGSKTISKTQQNRIAEWFMKNRMEEEEDGFISPSSLEDQEIMPVMEFLDQCRQMSKDAPPARIIDFVISHLSRDMIDKATERDIERLGLLAEEFADVSSFLDSACLYREGDISWKGSKKASGSEMVSMMTLHAAKGLEFPVVFICGCEDGLLPYRFDIPDSSNTQYNSSDACTNVCQTMPGEKPRDLRFTKGDENRLFCHSGEGWDQGFSDSIVCGPHLCHVNNHPISPYTYADLHEERRLFYVGMTRAAERLYLSWSRKRMRRGKRQENHLSCFVKEIPAALYRKTAFSSFRPQRPKSRQLSLW
ncbi:UvrD-helicase domain-containing protein [bacterium]|nr:UvrD-helicase domain-containing protein [bacterium]